MHLVSRDTYLVDHNRLLSSIYGVGVYEELGVVWIWSLLTFINFCTLILLSTHLSQFDVAERFNAAKCKFSSTQVVEGRTMAHLMD